MHLFPFCSCITRLRYSLVQITSLNALRDEVSELRDVKYCQEDSEHEDKLMEVSEVWLGSGDGHVM